MARGLLSVKGIQAAKPAAKEYLLSDGDGLFLRVLPSGKKTWQLVYSHNKQRRKIAFGDAADLTLAAARERANIERGRTAQGNDPRLELIKVQASQARELADVKAQAERRKSENLTVAEMADAWLSDGVARANANAELRRSFASNVLPRLGATPVRELNEADIRDVLRRIGRSRGKNRTAVVVLADLRQMFRWAEKRKPWRALLIDGNPADLVEAKQVVQTHYDLTNERDRVLSVDEIRDLRDILDTMEAEYLNAADKRVAARPLAPQTRLALWIILSTCCRIGELTMARWEHVNFQTGEWLVPRENTKTKVEWNVFLSDFALEKFKTLHGLANGRPWCFPATSGDGHLDSKSLSKQIGDRQFRFKNRKQLKNRRNDNSLVLSGGDWTPHDLRRTGSTLMQSLGVPEHIRERCLNHVVGGKIGRIYGRYEFAAEKRQAWTQLGSCLQSTLQALPPP